MAIGLQIAGLLKIQGEKFSSLLMCILGPFLIVCLFSLVGVVTYTYFTSILPYLLDHRPVWVCMLITSIGLFILFNILFNYSMCVLVGPGHPAPLSSENLCKVCSGPKPPRAHHCSICNKCVLKMDHHCPWIHNCVGYLNHRYFLLFLFYLTVGCFFIAINSYPMQSIRPRQVLVKVCFILCAVFSIVMLAFGSWHWFLAFKGRTTIEFFNLIGAKPEERSKYDFSTGKWRKNIQIIFGTKSLFKALMPRYSPLQQVNEKNKFDI